MPKGCKYILSLDGGGFRGLSSLIILNHIMRMLVDDPDEDPVPSPCQIFDLICGTSTGGIIAILLGRLCLDSATAISVYTELGPRVFGKDEGKMLGHILAGEQFSSAAFETFLAEVVETYTGSGTTTMRVLKSKPDVIAHQTTDVFVTTVSAGTGSAGTDAYRLRSYAKPRAGAESAPPNHAWTICQAARATSATPIYFAPLQIGSQAFQDSASSGFDNPVMEALDEAELRWSSKDHEFVVVSLGTGLASLLPDGSVSESGTAEFEKVAAILRGKLDNIAIAKDSLEQISKQLVSVANDTEIKHLDAARLFAKWKRSDDYFRFNPPQGLGDIGLADYISEGTVIEITNVWLRSPDGRESTLAAYEKLKDAYNTRNN